MKSMLWGRINSIFDTLVSQRLSLREIVLQVLVCIHIQNFDEFNIPTHIASKEVFHENHGYLIIMDIQTPEPNLI